MKPRQFTTYIEQVHRQKLARTLCMPGDRHNGLDLYNERVGIELKCHWRKYRWSSYACDQNRQVVQYPIDHPHLDLWWGFMLYDITKVPADIEWGEDVEPFVSYREVWFVPWNWVLRYPVMSPAKSGPFRYVPLRDVRQMTNLETFVTDGIPFHCPQGSGLQDKLIPF